MRLILMAVGLVAALVVGQVSDDSGPARPVLAWPAGLLEVRLAFDRAADPTLARTVVGSTITASAPQPGSVPRLVELKVAGARFEDDGRTLVLATDPHPQPATYTLMLPKAGEPDADAARLEGTPISYDLTGVSVEWSEGDAAEGTATRAGWWPHLDTARARTLAEGSLEHEQSFARLARPGRLTLRTVPISLPEGKVTLALSATAPCELTYGFETVASEPEAEGRHRAILTVEVTPEPLELSVVADTGLEGQPTEVAVTYRPEDDPKPGRPFERRALLVGWSPPGPPSLEGGGAVAGPALEGGDPVKGEAVFYSETAKCGTCHVVRGKGAAIGPDLTELPSRDRAWIYRQIAEPSAAIHPNFASYTVARVDGQIALGSVRAEGPDAIRVTDTSAKSVVIPRAEIEEIRPSTTSIMPVGLAAAIGDASLRDLLAFLTTPAAPNP